PTANRVSAHTPSPRAIVKTNRSRPDRNAHREGERPRQTSPTAAEVRSIKPHANRRIEVIFKLKAGPECKMELRSMIKVESPGTIIRVRRPGVVWEAPAP